MIRFSSVTLLRGSKILLQNADVTLNPGDRVGLVGPNGSGKSSIFSLLLGEIQVDQGDLTLPGGWRKSHVAQETPALARSAVEYVIDGDTGLRKLQAELTEAETQGDGERIGHLHSALADADAYTARARAEQLLMGLGFKADALNNPVASFSGGWRMRLNLAQALMAPADLMLLDEPTNHLDLDAILWLEQWLKAFRGTLIVISHDRDFLDGVINVTVHIDDTRLKRYQGNYSAFERQRAAALALAANLYEKQARQRAHLRSFVDRFRAKATKARQAQSRLKMLSRMEELAPIHAAAQFAFEFREPLAVPNPLLTLRKVDAGYQCAGSEPVKVLGGIEFTLQAGMRIGLLGVNGAGKSTFIRTVTGDLPALAGEITVGKGLVVGYFAQHQVDTLHADDTPLMHMRRLAPDAREQELRNFLGQFNFDGDMVTASLGRFSGGEKSRLALAAIVWQRPNLLLLDEPTNHLDLETREALTLALAQFEGTLVLVSHDRHLLRATTDQFMIVANGALVPFDGDLDDYRQWLLGSQRKNVPAPEPVVAADTKAAPPTTSREDPRERRARDARQRQALAQIRQPFQRRIERVEKRMAELTGKSDAIKTRLGDTAVYEPANKDELKQLLVDQAYVERELAEQETQWLQLNEDMELAISAAGGEIQPS
ncbi:MAG: ATP-binding cassette domain-containing protein [Gammaproteobacteria bacterium]|nr:ATP-binding cassette domain-containing protein [Gammaproteobacteria bacterium]